MFKSNIRTFKLFFKSCSLIYSLNSSEFNHVIIGFSQQRGERKYFYFKKFGDFEKEKPKEFDAYTKSFDIIENIDKKVVLTGCR